ncbi:hypothetical protein FKM82_004353 [Ascaphus truei]
MSLTRLQAARADTRTAKLAGRRAEIKETMQNQIYFSGPLNITYSKENTYETSQQSQSKTVRPKEKGIVRWHGAVSTNLVNQNVLIPKEESASGSDCESFIVPGNKKKSIVQKMKAALGKVVSAGQREGKPVKRPNTGIVSTPRNDLPDFPHTQTRLPKIIKDLSIPRVISKHTARRLSQAATLQVDVNVVEAKSERITADNMVVRSRRMTRRVSVTSVPTGLQKGSYLPKKRHFALVKKKKKPVDKVRYHADFTVGNLQMQVDDLIETVADKSTRLLAQRQAELQQCEFLGDEILQSSKQFQRVSKKSTRKYKLKNVCFPCICCCW